MGIKPQIVLHMYNFLLSTGVMAAILQFLVMAGIQDGWQHVEVED